MKHSQEIQLAAILGRFEGNLKYAQAYCSGIISDYPALAEEYQMYKKLLEARCSELT